jgi:hypothetical protein
LLNMKVGYMLGKLKQAHEELLGHISELEAILAEDSLDASTLARIRLQLSKASGRRRKLVAEAIQILSGNVSGGDVARLNLLRENSAAISLDSSHHVGKWSIHAILADPEGYRAASAAMRKSMRGRIAAEKSTLYPLLEQI